MKKRFVFSLLMLVLFASSCKKSEQELGSVKIIPEPETIVVGTGSFELTSESTYYAPPTFNIAIDFLQDFLSAGAGIGLTEGSENTSDIIFTQDTTLTSEGYTLSISEEIIQIKAADPAGAFYAVQTIRQLLPPELERINSLPQNSVQLPTVTIEDAPKFAYRGMHLDVARHFFPKQFIKDYISYLAMLKMNRFHWHLTDDQGWRIEIKKYPLLTQKAAFRDETLIGHYNETPQRFDGEPYGGFYTQEDIKEIVAFAEAHHVTIIPEIEMPGHAQAAISAYPELGCSAEDIAVATKWGVFEDIFCPNQKTFTFLKDVLTEVTDLFPGEYIHIGGDEAPKTRWKACDHCQQLIAKHNLTDEQGLQSWFITEIESFVNSRGKKIIGWDEILEGGLAPNATVMSWRGTEGAVAAANEGHDVILCPTSHAYFDYYQDDHPDEPVAIGGYLPLKKVYNFNPVPAELTGEARKKVLGAQGNIWTEYMKNEQQVTYMAFPRILAMAEVVWQGPSENTEADYPDFLSRVEHFMKRLDALDVTYANHLYDINGAIVKKGKQVFLELENQTIGNEIRVRLNGTQAGTYTDPILITEDTEILAQRYKEDSKVGRPYSEMVRYHKGITASIALNHEPHKAYRAGGKDALLNGVSGSDARYGDKEWLGFWGADLEITITPKEPILVSTITTRMYHAPGQWIHAPEDASVALHNADGLTFVVPLQNNSNPEETLHDFKFDLTENQGEKIIKIVLNVPSFGTIPDGMQGAGNKAWTFIDEIVIE